MSDPAYGIVKHVAVGYEEAVVLARAALKAQGFGVLTEIDVKKTMKEKLDVDFKPYIILGACNPQLAHKALTAEPDIGLMLPCNIVVYEEGPGAACVEAISPMAALSVVDSAILGEVAAEAQKRLTAAMDAVADQAGNSELVSE
ncbi:MAG: DUF302 domain-containing protein [Thermoleophilia bacterium]|nr:DUF302 domain-containing protein [Thermoleophilia bacterium]